MVQELLKSLNKEAWITNCGINVQYIIYLGTTTQLYMKGGRL